MRAYAVAIASLVIDAPAKWTDNLIAQHAPENVLSTGRGVARRVTHPALVHLALARRLHVELGVAVRDAVQMAGEMIRNGGTIHRSGLSLAVDLQQLGHELSERLAIAIESSPRPVRGRPASH